jgi:hypothetical protein
MFTKTIEIIVAALVLAGASITFVANASAAPSRGPTQDELSWMNRASGPDSGGYGPVSFRFDAFENGRPGWPAVRIFDCRADARGPQRPGLMQEVNRPFTNKCNLDVRLPR